VRLTAFNRHCQQPSGHAPKALRGLAPALVPRHISAGGAADSPALKFFNFKSHARKNDAEK
jgi:hypothetical protein